MGEEAFSSGRYTEAAELFGELACAEHCPDFLTLAAYGRITTITP